MNDQTAPVTAADDKAVASPKRPVGSLTRRMIVVAAFWITALLLMGGFALDRVLSASIVQNFDDQLEYVLNAMIASSEIGPDGHPKRGSFLPPVPLPRRMWAGGRLEFLQPLHVGERVERTSHVADVTAKEGRSGPLVFVLVRHEIAGERGLAIVEEHDIVYRGESQQGERPAAGRPAPVGAAWTRTIVPDDASAAVMGANLMDGSRSEDVLDAAFAQGRALAG